LQEQMLYNQIV